MTFERDLLSRVADYLQGTCKTVGEAIDALELGDEVDESELEAALVEVETERCGQCDWWHESFELEHYEEKGASFCDDCRAELGLPEP